MGSDTKKDFLELNEKVTECELHHCHDRATMLLVIPTTVRVCQRHGERVQEEFPGQVHGKNLLVKAMGAKE